MNSIRKPWFFSWYFQITAEEGAIALNPGVSTDRYGIGHAFVQLWDGFSGRFQYFVYPPGEFKLERRPFGLFVGPNYFGEEKIRLDFQTREGPLFGEIFLRGCDFSPRGLCVLPLSLWPGTGPKRRVLCERGEAGGRLLWGKEERLFARGRLFAESRRGSGCPDGWLWLQNGDPSGKGTGRLPF